MSEQAYIKFSDDQLEKVGNTAIYLSSKIPLLSKTKLLKLLYILDEISIKKSGIPFVNLTYKVWKFGPVSEELFVDLSSETTLLAKFIRKDEDSCIHAKAAFSDDEFSDNDMELMDFVVGKFGGKTAKELVTYTHRANSPWHNAAVKHSVLDLLLKEQVGNTGFLVDMSDIVAHDERKKKIYLEHIEAH